MLWTYLLYETFSSCNSSDFIVKACICALFISCADYLVGDTRFWDLLP